MKARIFTTVMTLAALATVALSGAAPIQSW
jgi:hypothetical protein